MQQSIVDQLLSGKSASEVMSEELTAFPNERIVFQLPTKEALVQVDTRKQPVRKMYVAVNPQGRTDFPQESDSGEVSWGDPSLFSDEFRAKAAEVMANQKSVAQVEAVDPAVDAYDKAGLMGRAIEVTFDDGTSLKTTINGPDEEIERYYVGQTFTGEDPETGKEFPKKAVSVKFLNRGTTPSWESRAVRVAEAIGNKIGDFIEYLNELPVPNEDLESEGGRIPDGSLYGDWMQQNDPIAFRVAFQEWVRNGEDEMADTGGGPGLIPQQDRAEEIATLLRSKGYAIIFDMPGEGFAIMKDGEGVDTYALTPDLQALVTELEQLTTDQVDEAVRTEARTIVDSIIAGKKLSEMHPDYAYLEGLDQFTEAYMDAILFTENDERDPEGNGGEPLDRNYGYDAFAPSTIASIKRDCAKFQADNQDAINTWEGSNESPSAQAGYDFWMTRNGQGVGFWESEWGAASDQLDAAAKAFGQSYAYLGDDDKIYISGDENYGGEAPPTETEQPQSPAARPPSQQDQNPEPFGESDINVALGEAMYPKPRKIADYGNLRAQVKAKKKLTPDDSSAGKPKGDGKSKTSDAKPLAKAAITTEADKDDSGSLARRLASYRFHKKKSDEAPKGTKMFSASKGVFKKGEDDKDDDKKKEEAIAVGTHRDPKTLAYLRSKARAAKAAQQQQSGGGSKPPMPGGRSESLLDSLLSGKSASSFFEDGPGTPEHGELRAAVDQWARAWVEANGDDPAKVQQFISDLSAKFGHGELDQLDADYFDTTSDMFGEFAPQLAAAIDANMEEPSEEVDAEEPTEEEVDPQEAYQEMRRDLQDGDCYVLQDGRGGTTTVIGPGGKTMGVIGRDYEDESEALAAIDADMTAKGFSPSIYRINDHGNVDQIGTDGTVYNEWV